jgi:hypothetical protein
MIPTTNELPDLPIGSSRFWGRRNFCDWEKSATEVRSIEAAALCSDLGRVAAFWVTTLPEIVLLTASSRGEPQYAQTFLPPRQESSETSPPHFGQVVIGCHLSSEVVLIGGVEIYHIEILIALE